MRIKSKYKIIGGFGLLIISNLIMGFVFFKGIIFGSKISLIDSDTWMNKDSLLTVILILGLEIFAVLLFMNEAKYIVVDNEKVVFINPVFPFLKKIRYFDFYDYYVTVDEYSRAGSYRAIWLIKNNRIKNRFSSFYYSNFTDLERNLKISYKGDLNANPFIQLFYLCGLKINKN